MDGAQISNITFTEISLEDLISTGMTLRERKDNISWELGDLAILVTEKFGPSSLDTFSKGIGVQTSTMRRYRDVSKAYEPQIRSKFKFLSWSHFQRLAAHPEREKLLEMATTNEWSVEKTYIMASEGVPEIDKPIPPCPRLTFCRGCWQWGFTEKVELCKTNVWCEERNK